MRAASGGEPEGRGIDGERAARLLRPLERAGVALLLVAALVPRLRDLGGSFDREIEGFQGAFFALCAINYERLGFSALGGYPVVNVDLPGADSGASDPATWYAYVNHPPTVPWIAWLSLKTVGPAGWDEAWREDRAPVGLEAALRTPFLALHLLLLACLWWAVRQGLGPVCAMVALALGAAMPVLVHYGSLVNYENAFLPFVLLAVGFHARLLRGAGRSAWVGFGASMLLAGCVTWAPVFYLAALVLHSLVRRRVALAAREAALGGACVLAPLAVHAWRAGRALETVGLEPQPAAARARLLLQPLLDGSAPLGRWFGLQLERGLEWISPAMLLAALLGLVLLRVPEREADEERIDVATPLFLGGLLAMLAFYRHTLEAQHNFLMLVAPGLAALAAHGLVRAGRKLTRLRAGIGPLVLLVAGVAMLAMQDANRLRHRHRAALDEELPRGVPRPEVALPASLGAELHALLPAGSVVLYPSRLGLNLAASFYSWRTLLPAESLPDGWPQALAQRHGLGAAPIRLVLPSVPPPAARGQVETLGAEARSLGEVIAESESWIVWAAR